MRPAPPTTTLIKQHNAVRSRIEQPPMPRRTPRTRTAVQDDSRLTLGIAAHLPVDEITTSDLQHALRIRFDLGYRSGISRLSQSHYELPGADSVCALRRRKTRPHDWITLRLSGRGKRSEPSPLRTTPIRGDFAQSIGRRGTRVGLRGPVIPKADDRIHRG